MNAGEDTSDSLTDEERARLWAEMKREEDGHVPWQDWPLHAVCFLAVMVAVGIERIMKR